MGCEYETPYKGNLKTHVKKKHEKNINESANHISMKNETLKNNQNYLRKISHSEDTTLAILCGLSLLVGLLFIILLFSPLFSSYCSSYFVTSVKSKCRKVSANNEKISVKSVKKK